MDNLPKLIDNPINRTLKCQPPTKYAMRGPLLEIRSQLTLQPDPLQLVQIIHSLISLTVGGLYTPPRKLLTLNHCGALIIHTILRSIASVVLTPNWTPNWKRRRSDARVVCRTTI